MVRQRNYELDLTGSLVAPLIYAALSFTWKLFRGLYLFLGGQNCSRAEHVQPRRTARLIVRSREVFESEQRPEKHTLEAPKERDGEKERERRRQAMLSGICITLVWRNARDLFTFSILWTRMRPLLGLANRSPEMISNSLSNFLPSARSVNRSSTSMRAWKARSSFDIIQFHERMEISNYKKLLFVKSNFIHQ